MTHQNSMKFNPFHSFMMNGRFLIVCAVFNSLTIAMAIWVNVRDGFDLVAWLFPLIGIIFSIYAYVKYKHAVEVVARMQDVLKDSRKGQLHGRVSNTQGLGEIGMAAWELNDFLDLIETYFKEVNTCFSLVSEGVFYRKALAHGLPGQFADSLVRVNQASGRWKPTSSSSARTNWPRAFMP